MSTTIKDKIQHYIHTSYDVSNPIIQKDLYRIFNNINPITIRQTLIRLAEEEEIYKSNTVKGVYFKPNPNRILNEPTMNFSKLIEQKYLMDLSGNRIGYITGFVLSNQLGLTSQSTNVTYIYSNAVAERKREVEVDNRRFVINRSRVFVNDRNYRLLQILDLVTDYEKYSEYPIEKALRIFSEYMKTSKLTKEKMESILNSYPIKTQLQFYKLEVDHVITPKS